MKTPKKRFQEQKDAAKQRGIGFNLSFDEWWNIWEQSGKYNQRGCRKGQYVMSRINDTGAYEVNNVFIQTCGGNNSDAHKGRPKPKSKFTKQAYVWTPERRKQFSDTLKGRKQPTRLCELCKVDVSKSNYDRHVIKCKSVGQTVS